MTNESCSSFRRSGSTWDTWATGSAFSFWFPVIIIVTTEYSYRTMRQNIITGLSRRQCLHGQSIFILVQASPGYCLCLCALSIGYFSTASVYWHKVWQNADTSQVFSDVPGGSTHDAGLPGKRAGIRFSCISPYVMFLELILRWGVPPADQTPEHAFLPYERCGRPGAFAILPRW